MQCLEGTLVLDLCRRNPGAYSAMLLADFGANVIKIDPPAGKIQGRKRPIPEEKFAAFNALDRNKRSITLNLKKPGAREILLRLVEKADVLMEGFRPGVMDRLGIGYLALSKANPRLVYCSLSGFGSDGPYAQVPAHDINFVALGGALSLIGEKDGQPYCPSNIVGDFGGAAMHGALGITLALLARERTGRGQLVDISYLDSVISQLAPTFSNYFASGEIPKRGRTITTGAAPWSQVLRCKDGEYFTIGAAEPHLWANLCRALGRKDLIAEHEPASEDRANRVIEELRNIFITRTRDEWFALLGDKNACVGPVYDIEEVCRDPQVLHRQMITEIDHPVLGRVKQLGVPIKLSHTPGSIRSLGVPTGQDTADVLQELGYTEYEIRAFRNSEVLG